MAGLLKRDSVSSLLTDLSRWVNLPFSPTDRAGETHKTFTVPKIDTVGNKLNINTSSYEKFELQKILWILELLACYCYTCLTPS